MRNMRCVCVFVCMCVCACVCMGVCMCVYVCLGRSNILKSRWRFVDTSVWVVNLWECDYPNSNFFIWNFYNCYITNIATSKPIIHTVVDYRCRYSSSSSYWGGCWGFGGLYVSFFLQHPDCSWLRSIHIAPICRSSGELPNQFLHGPWFRSL